MVLPMVPPVTYILPFRTVALALCRAVGISFFNNQVSFVGSYSSMVFTITPFCNPPIAYILLFKETRVTPLFALDMGDLYSHLGAAGSS
ncbi:hypothetical protein D3C78_1432040 [compost metagenome]